MGICKGCSKAVSVVEIKDGYCEDCLNPGLKEEKLKIQKERTQKREAIFLTTETVINLDIDKRIDLISSEYIYGINLGKIFFIG